MTYRMIIAILLCFMLSACSGTPPLPTVPDEEQLTLPERFLGTWVYSYYDIISIHPDGLIKDYHTKDKDADLLPDGVYDSVELDNIPIEQTGTSAYRIIYIESPYSIYLLYRNNRLEPYLRNYQYIHMIIFDDRYIYKDRPEYLDKPPFIGWTYGCNTTEEDWTTPQTVLQERLLGSTPDDCTINKLEELDWPHQSYWRGVGLKINDGT